MIAFSDPAYGGLIIYPPPLSYVIILLLPFAFCRGMMTKLQKGLSMLRFWIENTVLIFAFVIFEILILPVAYVKIWINLIKNSHGLCKTLCHLSLFLLLGPLMIFYFVIKDVCCFLSLLRYYEGCKFGRPDELADEDIDDRLKLQLYNEVRATVIILYKKLKKYLKEKQKEEDEEEDEDFDDDEDEKKDEEEEDDG